MAKKEKETVFNIDGLSNAEIIENFTRFKFFEQLKLKEAIRVVNLIKGAKWQIELNLTKTKIIEINLSKKELISVLDQLNYVLGKGPLYKQPKVVVLETPITTCVAVENINL